MSELHDLYPGLDMYGCGECDWKSEQPAKLCPQCGNNVFQGYEFFRAGHLQFNTVKEDDGHWYLHISDNHSTLFYLFCISGQQRAAMLEGLNEFQSIVHRLMNALELVEVIKK